MKSPGRTGLAFMKYWCVSLVKPVHMKTLSMSPRFGSIDRLIFVGLFRGLSTAHDALAIIQPATVIRWHRAGFRAYWRWKSRVRGGQADGAAGSTPLDPCDEPCEPALGRTADAWRTPQARHRRRADERDEVYGAQEATTISGLEDVSPQSR